jgi:hypothetical protein
MLSIFVEGMIWKDALKKVKKGFSDRPIGHLVLLRQTLKG